MIKPRWGGKEKIITYLRNKEGYSYHEARKLVDIFVKIVQDFLVAGKDVELEGLGTLVAEKDRPTRRRIDRNFGRPTIRTINARKTVKLKKQVKWRLDV